MSLIRDIEIWLAERRERRKRKLMLKAERELAVEEARLKEIERQDAMCKTFKFSTQLIDTKGNIARLRMLIEQHRK